MTRPTFFFTDVFTDRRYGGNPLATFVDCDALSGEEMQNIAREINFSETTFITSRAPREGGFDVRIFTPRAEIDFAGHPTLGTAWVIREALRLSDADRVVLNLRIGQIPVTFARTADAGLRLWMRQVPPTFGRQREAHEVTPVLGLDAAATDIHLPIEEVSTGLPTLIVPIAALDALKRIRVNREAYARLIEDAEAKIVLAFCRQGREAGHDLSVRMFADYYGVPEDPATGSANGALAAYLVRHGLFGKGALDVVAGQGHEIGRPSTLYLQAKGTGNSIVVEVGGGVVAVAQGTWG